MKRLVLVFDSAVPLVFDGIIAQCFVVDLHNTVASSRVKNITPGMQYTFIIHQNDIGNHGFEWPDVCRNATAVDPEPDATTVQNFIGTTGGYLDANVASAWSAP